MELKDLTSLPEQLQVILASGYLGYSIAYAGYRDNERKDDVLYGILAFGIFGYGFYDFTRRYYSTFLIPGIGALLAAILSAIVWRKYGRTWFNFLLHRAAISNEDGIRTVWTRISQDTNICPTQIVVTLKDGSDYVCEDVQMFRDAPIPLYYTDSDGSIALYATQRTTKDGETKDMKHTRDESMGDRLTYIPKDLISNVSIRFIKKK